MDCRSGWEAIKYFFFDRHGRSDIFFKAVIQTSTIWRRLMVERFRLFCEYTHCCGKQVLELGTADTKEKARQWQEQQILGAARPRLEENDLILTCPVRHCPAKFQVPRFAYAAGPKS
jgi:hypothetical protein